MSEKLNIALLWLTGTAFFADIVWLLLMMYRFSM